MTTLEAVACYSGRMNRADYWRKGVLPIAVMSAVVMTPLLMLVLSRTEWAMGGSAAVLLSLLPAALLWFRLPADVKRLHDRNHSAWYLLISLIPLIGPLWLFVEAGFLQGTRGDNQFGPATHDLHHPPAASSIQRSFSSERQPSILAWVSALLFLASLFVAGGIMPLAANIHAECCGEAARPALLFNLAAAITHRYGLFFAPALGYMLWLPARLVYTRTRTWALWCMLAITIGFHVLMAVAYIPALKMCHALQPGMERTEGQR